MQLEAGGRRRIKVRTGYIFSKVKALLKNYKL
jgi:hypothetical protein